MNSEISAQIKSIKRELENYKDYLKKSDLGQRPKEDYIMLEYIINKL